MQNVDVVLGLQSGDEGKGRVVDDLLRFATENKKPYKLACKFNGGPNSGHTVYRGKQKIILHHIPIGILHGIPSIIGNGCVINPITLVEEIKYLNKLGYETKDLLMISSKAHVITSAHIEQDDINNSIGSTKRGIGPCYSDKYARKGMILGNVPLEIRLKDTELYNAARWLTINKYIYDTRLLIQQYSDSKILCEGSQGFLLDIDHGIYPYVSSSNCTIGGVITGLGIPATSIRKVIGVMKLYMTKVGEGPFPTLMDHEDAEYLRKLGTEFGATTGRPRKIGWLDLVQLNTAIKTNGITDLAITKTDIVDKFIKHSEMFKVCTTYFNTETQIIAPYSSHSSDYYSLKAGYKLIDDWRTYIDAWANQTPITPINFMSNGKSYENSTIDASLL
jgi:adenylosuccinate synthase